MNYKEKIEKGIFEIENTDEDIIIIGDNSIGKTDILSEYLTRNESKKIYFIDSYNKMLNVNNLKLKGKISKEELPRITDVVEFRRKEENFNLKDSFGPVGMIVERFYPFFKNELDELVFKFLNIKLEFKFLDIVGLGVSKIEININEEKYDKLSNGYQSIIRLFLELLYADKFDIKEVIIDEITEFLSPKNEEKIFPFLKEQFPNIRFIVTTHSSELIASAYEGKLLILNEDYLEVQKLEYFETPTDVRKVYLRMFSDDSKEKKTFESIVRELLMKKRLNNLKGKDLEILNNIDEKKLNYTYQKILTRLKEDIRG